MTAGTSRWPTRSTPPQRSSTPRSPTSASSPAASARRCSQEQGLGAALEALAGRLPLPVATDLRLEGRLPDVVEATAYFAASEALANVLKHADARSIRLTAAVEDGELVLRVSDDGRGGADADGGSGLVGLRDRLEALRGSLAVDSPAEARHHACRAHPSGLSAQVRRARRRPAGARRPPRAARA